jgi:small subunit ribosomal protein S11
MATAQAKAKKTTKKKKLNKIVPNGRAYVQATFNNTIVTLADQNGDVLGWASAGMIGFKGPKKATPYAAGQVVKKVVDATKQYGLKEVNVFVKGIGGGREGAIRGFNANGVNVLSIKDITPIPHNGCRPPKRRRV